MVILCGLCLWWGAGYRSYDTQHMVRRALFIVVDMAELFSSFFVCKGRQ